MNIKINFSECVSLVILAVYLKNSAIPYYLWEVGGLTTTILKYFMLFLILIPLIILYNGLKHKE